MKKHKIIIIAAAAALVLITLIIPPFFGRNDDGSLSKLISRNGLTVTENANTDSLDAKFGVTAQSGGTFMPIIMAKTANSVFCKEVFDIRFMSLIYLPVFLVGLYLFISSINLVNKKAQIAVCILAAIVLCDAAYISFYNSFYYDALYLSALTLLFGSLAVMCSKEGVSITAMVLALLAVTIIASAGAFGAAVAILTAILFFTMGFGDKSMIRKPFTVAISLLIVAISLSVLNVAPAIKGGDADRYNALFAGALTDSEDIKEDLSYFGIPEKYAALADKSYKEAGKEMNLESYEVKKELFSKITPSKTLAFYISHPSRLYKVFDKAVHNLPALSQDYISTETDKSFLKIAPALWSTVHRFVTPGSLLILLAFFIIIIVVSVLSMKKAPFLSKTAVFSVLVACVLLAESVISGGLANIGRRLVLFGFVYDMILIMCIIGVINTITGHRAK